MQALGHFCRNNPCIHCPAGMSQFCGWQHQKAKQETHRRLAEVLVQVAVDVACERPRCMHACSSVSICQLLVLAKPINTRLALNVISPRKALMENSIPTEGCRGTAECKSKVSGPGLQRRFSLILSPAFGEHLKAGGCRGRRSAGRRTRYQTRYVSLHMLPSALSTSISYQIEHGHLSATWSAGQPAKDPKLLASDARPCGTMRSIPAFLKFSPHNPLIVNTLSNLKCLPFFWPRRTMGLCRRFCGHDQPREYNGQRNLHSYKILQAKKHKQKAGMSTRYRKGVQI